MCVTTGCGCKEVYRFPYTTYPYSSCISSFLEQHPYFLFIFKCLSFLYIIVRVGPSHALTFDLDHGIHMKAAHIVLYINNRTQTYASYPAMDISCMSMV